MCWEVLRDRVLHVPGLSLLFAEFFTRPKIRRMAYDGVVSANDKPVGTAVRKTRVAFFWGTPLEYSGEREGFQANTLLLPVPILCRCTVLGNHAGN